MSYGDLKNLKKNVPSKFKKEANNLSRHPISKAPSFKNTDEESELETPSSNASNLKFQFKNKNPEDLNEFDFDNMESDSSVYEDLENEDEDRLESQAQILAMIDHQKKIAS